MTGLDTASRTARPARARQALGRAWVDTIRRAWPSVCGMAHEGRAVDTPRKRNAACLTLPACPTV